jgi:hypothetical protein
MQTGLLCAADGVDYNAAAAKNRTGRCKNGGRGGGGKKCYSFYCAVPPNAMPCIDSKFNVLLFISGSHSFTVSVV